MKEEKGEEKRTDNREIVYSDGSRGEFGDFPVAVAYLQTTEHGGTRFDNLVVDPIFSSSIFNNLYGRIMTLIEATTEPQRLKAVKDVFSKELKSWENDVYESARELSNNCDSSTNLYTRSTSEFLRTRVE